MRLAEKGEPLQGTETQDDALACALKNRLTIVCGGPGTGKTTAVKKILTTLLKTEPGLCFKLIAPTGKAAARLQESLVSENSEIQNCETSTIHALICGSGDQKRPTREDPVKADVIVVDECSMMDINLAASLLDVIDPKATKLILLGDRHQLSAVGPGSIFSDLCARTAATNNHLIELKKSFRFLDSSTIGRFARAIKENSVTDVMEVLQHPELLDGNPVHWHKKGTTFEQGVSREAQVWLRQKLSAFLQSIRNFRFTEENAESLLALAKSLGILCATREDPMGVEKINETIENWLEREGFQAPYFRLKIIRRNDSLLGVHNGDIGLVLPIASEEGVPYFYLGKNACFKYGLMPENETAFAISIHQSQGSEYATVGVFMPQDENSPLATRELLYTAVTRVKDVAENSQTRVGDLTIFSKESVLRKAVQTAIQREGALRERLVAFKEINRD